MSQASDEQLMLQYARGDVAAFEQLYQRYRGSLYRYLLRQTRDKQLAEDMYQEVWGKVITSAPDYEVRAKFTTWLFRMAHNKVIDQVRHLKVVDNLVAQSEGEVLSSAVDEHGLPGDALENHRAALALRICLEKLPQMQLDSFLMKEEAGLTASEIAHVLEASVEATKSRLRYAYQSLRQCVTQKLGKVVA